MRHPARFSTYPSAAALLLALACAAPARGVDLVQLDIDANVNDAEVRAAFVAAAKYWNAQLVGRPGNVAAHVVLDVSTPVIDGQGGILGSAGPNNIQWSNTTSRWYTTTGQMRFDSADMQNMKNNGSLPMVILHEMGHTLGVGTLWDNNNLYVNNSGNYTGPNALAAWRDEFNRPDDLAVPVELEGGGGTANGHWNEVANGGGATGRVSRYAVNAAGVGYDMRNELMTGWANTPAFISTVTIRQFEDLGYTVHGRLGLWSGASTASSNWSQTANWSGIVLSLGSTLMFDGTRRMDANNDLAADRTYKDIVFTSGIASPDAADNWAVTPTTAFTLTGNAIRLTEGVTNHSGVLQTINLNIGLDGNAHTVNAASGNIRIGGILSAVTVGAGLTKTGTRTLTLAGNNTYDGLTTVSNGILEVVSGGTLGATTAGTTVSAGASLKLTGVAYANAEALSLNGTGYTNGGALVNSGTSSYTGAVTLATSATLNAGNGTLTLTGGMVKNNTTATFTGGGRFNLNTVGITGTGPNSGLVVSGTVLAVNAASSFNGATTVQTGGRLILGNTLNIGAGNLRVDGTSKLSGASTLTTSGSLQLDAGGMILAGDDGTINTLTIAGAGARVLDGTYLFDVDFGATTGTGDNQGDLLLFTGAASADISGMTFDLGTALNAANAGSAYAIKIFESNVATTGTFTTANLLAGQSVSSSDGGRTYYLRYGIVPEPASFALLGLGSLLLLRRPSRRRQAQAA